MLTLSVMLQTETAKEMNEVIGAWQAGHYIVPNPCGVMNPNGTPQKIGDPEEVELIEKIYGEKRGKNSGSHHCNCANAKPSHTDSDVEIERKWPPKRKEVCCEFVAKKSDPIIEDKERRFDNDEKN